MMEPEKGQIVVVNYVVPGVGVAEFTATEAHPDIIDGFIVFVTREDNSVPVTAINSGSIVEFCLMDEETYDESLEDRGDEPLVNDRRSGIQ